MNIFDYFKNQRKCRHEKVPMNEDICYCPDCGELIENRWYICRCSCCGIKIKAIFKNGQILADENFCHNCGSHRFEVEQVSKINCIDINYAVLVKTVIAPNVDTLTQSWLDTQNPKSIKLITQT